MIQIICEIICSRFKNRVPLRIDFRADWTHESNSAASELKVGKNHQFRIKPLNKDCKKGAMKQVEKHI